MLGSPMFRSGAKKPTGFVSLGFSRNHGNLTNVGMALSMSETCCEPESLQIDEPLLDFYDFLCLKTLGNWARLKSWMTSLPYYWFDLIFDNSWHIFSMIFFAKERKYQKPKPPNNYIKLPSCGGTKQPISRSTIRPRAPHLPRS